MYKFLMAMMTTLALTLPGIDPARAATRLTPDMVAAVCMSTNSEFFRVPASQLTATCACAGVVSSLHFNQRGLSDADIIMKGLHGCVSNQLVGRYYEKMARKASGNLTVSFREPFADCISMQAQLDSAAFAADGRDFDQHLKRVMNNCQYIIGADAFVQILSLFAR